MADTKIFVKKEASSDPKLGKRIEERSVEELIELGVVNIDKPSGPTSHQVSDFVQKILNVEKAGHGGSLDPRVTGVLPVAIERATRLAHVLLIGGKEYVCIMHLHEDVPEEKIREVIRKFVGKITQMPPIKSAVKRQEREREVYFFDVIEIDGRDVLFRIGCQAGTYIRKICHDFGRALGTGAHMAELRRTRASCFYENSCVTLQDLQDAFVMWKEKGNDKFIRHCVQPAENMVEHLPKIWVLDSAVESICHGRAVAVPGISKLNEMRIGQMVAIMTLKDELVALGVAQMKSDDVVKAEKGIAVKTSKVFMVPGTYSGA